MSKTRLAAILFIISFPFLLALHGCSANFSPGDSQVSASSGIKHVAAYDEQLGGNEIWCAPMQLCWNQAMLLNSGALGGTDNESTRALNKQGFTKRDLSDDSYYAYGDVVEDPVETKTIIKTEVLDRFGEESEIIDNADIGPGDLFFYAMLLRKFSYKTAFCILDDAAFSNADGSMTQAVHYFGFDENTSGRGGMASQVSVLYYDDENHHAVAIDTEDGDVVVLARSPQDGSPSEMYEAVLEKARAYEGNANVSDNDTLKIPDISFDVEETMGDLLGASIDYQGQSYAVSDAFQKTKLSMDNEGGEIKSEAYMTVTLGAAVEPEVAEPRHFDYTGDYALFLVDGFAHDVNASNIVYAVAGKPYFAARICDISLFQQN